MKVSVPLTFMVTNMHGAVTKVRLPNQRPINSLGPSATGLASVRRFRFDSRRVRNRLAPPNFHPTLGFPTRPARSTGVPIGARTACSHGLSRTPVDAARRSGTGRSQLIIPWSQVRSLPGPPIKLSRSSEHHFLERPPPASGPPNIPPNIPPNNFGGSEWREACGL